MASKSFGTKQPLKPHLIVGDSGIPGEVGDLRRDIEEAFLTTEGRVGFPTLAWLTGAVTIPGGGNLTIKGTGLLQSQTFDSAALTSGTAVLTFTAMAPGVSGLSVEIVAASGTLNLSYASSKLTIRPAAGGSTAHDIATAVNADVSPVRGILRCAETASGTVNTVVAATALAGGVGSYAGNTVTVSGVACTLKNTTGDTGAAAWSDTTINVIVPALSGTPGMAEGDTALVKVTSNGIQANSISMGTLGAASSGGPLLEWLDGAAFAAAGGTAVLRGSDLLQSQTFDTLTLGADTAAVKFDAMKPGDSGISVVITQGAGALTVTYAASLLTVELAAAGSTSDQVATEVNKSGSQAKGIVRATGYGAGTVLVASSAPMTGGVGTYAGNKVLVSGVAALPLHATGTTPAATWTDTAVSVTVPDLTAASPARAAGDNVVVRLWSNGLKTESLSNVLA